MTSNRYQTYERVKAIKKALEKNNLTIPQLVMVTKIPRNSLYHYIEDLVEHKLILGLSPITNTNYNTIYMWVKE